MLNSLFVFLISVAGDLKNEILGVFSTGSQNVFDDFFVGLRVGVLFDDENVVFVQVRVE